MNSNRIARSGARLALWIGFALGLAGCAPRPPAQPPSILLFVMDTTRADAVSAYGRIAGTTPTVDRLAEAGLRYTRAYAQASWTVPSHATLFTGLLPSQHGVTYETDLRLPDAHLTLAERLREAGYETAGLSENVFVSRQFNFAQGFDHFARIDRARPPGLDAKLAEWLPRFDPSRPLFLFVNVMDAHAPYRVDPESPFLPAGADAQQARRLPLKAVPYQCAAREHRRELEILYGVYLANVRKADAKLAALLARLEASAVDRRWIVMVTSDHGEHFGERDLVGHGFSVGGALLDVPLVVYGLPGVACRAGNFCIV